MIAAGVIRAPTLASVIAGRLEDEIIARRWPIGEVLGSEADLLGHFGVSRAAFREAVRIVEHTGVAKMKRGPGGGLVVTQPDRTSVVAALGAWFAFVGVTAEEMLEARVLLLGGACELAAAHRDRKARSSQALEYLAGLRPTLDPAGLISVESAVADLAGNPALTLFVEAIADLSMSRLRSAGGRVAARPPASESLGSTEAYRQVIVAVADGDGGTAIQRVQALGETLRIGLAQSPSPSRKGKAPSESFGGSAGGKMAAAVAQTLRDHIERAGWPVGEVIGSETELIEQLGVSRAILREAVRILEHYGVVETKRGPGGGILVCAPDATAIGRTARFYLEYEGVTPTNLSETRRVIEVASARLAAERGGPELAEHLDRALQSEGETGDAAVSFGRLHHLIAEGTGNRLIPLFVDVMGELVPSHLKAKWRSARGQATLSAEVHRTHQRLVRAIIDGHSDEAAKRMKRHMTASAHEFS